MKILITTHYFAPHVGGIEIVAQHAARELGRRGHQVTVLTSALDDDAPRSAVAGVSVIRVPAWNPLERRLGVPYPLFFPSLVRTTRDLVDAADLVHVHGHVYLPSACVAFWAERLGRPLVLTQHNTFIAYPQRALRALEALADRTLGRAVLARADRLIGVSQETVAYLVRLTTGLPGAPQPDLVYNGVDAERFAPGGARSQVRARLGLADEVVALSVRRITFKNGIDDLLLAARELRDRVSVRWLVAGRGPDLARAQAFVQQAGLANVQLLGFVPDAELPSLYQAADLFVLPSRGGEGFPLVVLEAFASGLPVVATRSGGQVEIVRDGETGALVAPNRPAELATAIAALAADPSGRARLGQRARALVERDLTWERHVDALEKVYQQAQQARHPPTDAALV